MKLVSTKDSKEIRLILKAIKKLLINESIRWMSSKTKKRDQ